MRSRGIQESKRYISVKNLMLELRDVSVKYGEARALSSVSILVREGDSVGIVGRNGSGKTTLLKTIMGLLDVVEGNIYFEGAEIAGSLTYAIARRGIAFVPEDRRMFPNMTVEENLALGAEATESKTDLGDRFGEIYDIFPALNDLRKARAGILSGGEQQMVSIGRALMSEPRLLILDEPAEGLAPVIVRGLRDRLQLLEERGVTLLVSEQNLHFLSAVTDRCYVLDRGHVRYEGSTAELWDQPDLLKSYLTV